MIARYRDDLENRIDLEIEDRPEAEWTAFADGALSTVRWEMMVEGVQECEAKIFLEKALVDKARRAKLGEELAQRAQGLLDDRIRAAEWGWQNPGWFVSSGWQDRTARLYALAAETATALRK